MNEVRGFNMPDRKERVKVEILNRKSEREHFHQDFELIYILAGTMEISQRNGKYSELKADDVIMINSGIAHSYKSSDDILFVKITILYHMISDVFDQKELMFWCDSSVSQQGTQYDELRRLLKLLLRRYVTSKGDMKNFGHIALCYRVIDFLTTNFLVQISEQRVYASEQEKYDDRINQINYYISANYNQPISMKELSEKLFLSNGYLSRFFKKTYGMNFADYLTQIRLYHAMEELLYTENPITRIVYDTGFSSVAMFNRSFKKVYGETPTAVRKKFLESGDKEQGKLNAEVAERLEDYLKNDGIVTESLIKEDEIIEASFSVLSPKPLVPVWNQMINAGSAEDMLRSDVKEHIILLKSLFDFKYVRFWSLFNKRMYVDLSGNGEEYNFSRLDIIFDFLLNNGIKPHIEAGNKPKRVHRGLNDIILNEPVGHEFPGVVKWAQMMDAFMRHIVHRYGQEEIDTWRIEIWAHEDKWGDPEDAKLYYETFTATYRVVRKYSPYLQVGGPGFCMDFLKTSGPETFLKNWGKYDIRPDFFSVLYYAYEIEEGSSDTKIIRSTDENGMLHCIQEMRNVLDHNGFDKCKLIISEWNLTISDRNAINDTSFKGAYCVKNMLDLYGLVDEMGYFVGSDRIAEHYDTSKFLFGGTGIVNKDGALKPAAYAFDFMNRLYPYFIAKGSNYIVTTNQRDSYGIVCHNLRKLSYNYYLTKEDEISKEHLWSYFEDNDSLEMKINLQDVANGRYKIKLYQINKKSGSLIEMWDNMHFDAELSKNDIQYLKNVSVPKLSIGQIEVSDHKLNLDLKLQASEIMFVRIRKVV